MNWEYSVSPFSVWTPISNTGTTYTSGLLTQTTQFRAVVQNGVCASIASVATTVTVNPIPVPTFSVQPGTAVCANVNVSYTTQSGQSNYVWTVPGTAGVDYNIISGGTSSTSNTVTLQWLTTGNKTVLVRYSSNSCADTCRRKQYNHSNKNSIGSCKWRTSYLSGKSKSFINIK
ncbi:hypothetical protein ACQ9BO_01445 [Flavobacterium sp. P21]|uniref:hypothetical protein n=1 Tax=Flavobacterium sp. P21 TaxID=3423948 RepID=UPI003D66B1EF